LVGGIYIGFIKKYLYDPDRPKRKYDNITEKDVETAIKESILTNDTSWGNYETNQQKEVKMYAFKKVVDLGLEAIPSLYKLLENSDPKVRYRAIEALEKINANEYIKDPDFYNPIIKLKYDPDSKIRSAALLAYTLRINLMMINVDSIEEDTAENTAYSSDDDTLYSTIEMHDKEPKKKNLSEQLIDENDKYMDDIIAGIHK
jgi:hypothetical protein